MKNIKLLPTYEDRKFMTNQVAASISSAYLLSA